MFAGFTDRRLHAVVLLTATALGGCAATPPAREAPAGPDPALANRLGAAVDAATSGQTGRAESMLNGLSDERPDLVAPQLNLAILYAETGRREEAETVLERLLTDSPEDPAAWNQLGVLRRRDGRFGEADEAYSMALAADPTYAPAYRNRGVLLDLYLGRPGEALEHYRRYVELQGGDEEVERWVAELELRLGTGPGAKVAER